MKQARNMMLAATAAGLLASAGQARADEVTHWVGVLQQAIRVNGGAPCPIGRAIALTQLAVYEAVNSITRTHTPYHVFVTAPPGCSPEAAVAQAAHDMLVWVYPAQTASFDAELAARLALIPDGPAESGGIVCGAAAAASIIAVRTGDHADDPMSYTFGSNPGDYVTPEDVPPATPPFTPGWGNVVPFAMPSGTFFRPPNGPDGLGYNMAALLASPQYATQFNEVKDFGARISPSRTQDQTELAFFWANDVNGTYKPPGHLMNIAVEISNAQGLTLAQNARLMALMGLAMGDAGVVAWDSKYLTPLDLWRPISGIRRAGTDGNPATVADPAWLPLNAFTPPFPAWISGHSTFGGATAGVLAGYFGTDSMTFSITSEDPFYAALVPTPPTTRTFTSFSSMGFEDAISRVYLGVHWRWDCTDGYNQGHALGTHITNNYLRPLCPTDFDDGSGTGTPDGGVTIDDLLYYLDIFTLGLIRADIDNGSLTGTPDGGVTIDDLLYFIFRFDAGC